MDQERSSRGVSEVGKKTRRESGKEKERKELEEREKKLEEDTKKVESWMEEIRRQQRETRSRLKEMRREFEPKKAVTTATEGGGGSHDCGVCRTMTRESRSWC